MAADGIRVRAPGKLFVLGEYAVLEPGAEALVLAVPRFVKVRIEPDPGGAIALDCPGLGIAKLGGRLDADGPRWDAGADVELVKKKLRFVDAALALAAAIARRERAEPRAFRMRIESELGAGSSKPGLGGSASISTAVAAALLAWCGVIETDVESDAARNRVFRIASLAHFVAQGRRGSGADVAAAVMGGLVAYRNSGFDDLLGGAKSPSTSELAEIASQPWPKLCLASAPWPEDHVFLAAASGEAASTTGLVDRLGSLTGSQATLYATLRADLGQLARDAVAAPSPAGWKRAMVRHQGLLEQFDAALGGAGIVTPALSRLAAAARERRAAAKISGAGGGDSVIALVETSEVEALDRAWTSLRRETLRIDRPVPGLTLHRD